MDIGGGSVACRARTIRVGDDCQSERSGIGERDDD